MAILVKDEVPEVKVKLKGSNLELLCLEFTPLHAKSFSIVAWYRPPTLVIANPSFEALREMLKGFDSEDKQIILMGDRNCDKAAVP